jgi:hypothetical protein
MFQNMWSIYDKKDQIITHLYDLDQTNLGIKYFNW